MKTSIDSRLRREAKDYELRFTCGHCAYYDVPRGRCSEGYPNEAHREVNLRTETSLEFCKRFELT